MRVMLHCSINSSYMNQLKPVAAAANLVNDVYDFIIQSRFSSEQFRIAMTSTYCFAIAEHIFVKMITKPVYFMNLFIIFITQELVLGICFVKGDDLENDYKIVSIDLDTYILLKNDIYFEIIQPQELSYTFKVHPAKNFGMLLQDTTYVNIALVLAEPFHGCSTLYNSHLVRNNIVLVQRGDCSFLSKALQAEKHGALGILIADNEVFNDNYIEMVDDNTDRKSNIPCAFLLGKNGQMIEKTLRKKKLEQAVINIPVNLTNIPQHKQKQPP
uniref:PA domain-containing protein n=1 Tax=Strigamia maritima TaxID=126957 RepID=T1JH71_STRMM